MAALAALLHQPAPAGAPPPTIAWRSLCSSQRCTPITPCTYKQNTQGVPCSSPVQHSLQLLECCMQASTAALGFDTRQSLRGNTAKAVGLPVRFITLERISSSSSGDGSCMNGADKVDLDSATAQPGLEVQLHVRLGAAQSAGEELMGRSQVPLGLEWHSLSLSTCVSLLSRSSTRHIAQTLWAP